MDSKVQIALNYVDAINTADIGRLYDLMESDHLFIDAHDNKVMGKDDMKQAWVSYFSMFPDYKIEVNEILEKDSLICILGYASGTYKNLKNKENSNYWRVPATWTVVIENDKVKQWQVYADNTFAIEIYKRNEQIS
jgi:ketosteroid isomerase-like protein